MAGAALPLGLAAGGAVLGAFNNKAKQDAANRQRQVAASVARWSPWTGMNASSFMPQEPGTAFGDITQGAFGGGMLGLMANKAGGSNTPPASAGGTMTAGGFEQSPWAKLQQQPTIYG